MTTRSTNEEERVRTLSFLLFRIRDAIYLASSAQGGGGGGGTPFYKLYNYVRHQREWFLSRFGLKITHFGLK